MKIKKITNGEKTGCLGKIKHNSELAAKHHLDQLRSIGKTPQTLCMYKCLYCSGWHCGNNNNQ